MYDSVSPERIPVDAAMVAGYIQGPYAWSAADWARFPHARHVQIATVARPPAGVMLDVERGDAAPDLAPNWCVLRREAGVDPSVYMNMSTWPVVRAAFHAHAVAEPHYWVADYDGIAVLPAGAIAKQYATEQPPGCDTSIVADFWPGVDPAPTPPPDTQGHADMWMYQDAAGTIWLVDGDGRVAFQHIADVDRYLAKGTQLHTAAEFTPEWNATIIAKYPAR